MILKEIWVSVDEEIDEERPGVVSSTWMPMTVIKLTKSEIVEIITPDGKTTVLDRTHVLCFHKETGELGELDFRATYAKQIYNEENQKTYDFDSPSREEGEKNR